MPLDAALYGAVATAAIGLLAAIVAKIRCRCLVHNHDDGDVAWSVACGFSEFRLPAPEGKLLETYPLQGDTLYVRKGGLERARVVSAFPDQGVGAFEGTTEILSHHVEPLEAGLLISEDSRSRSSIMCKVIARPR